MKGHYFYNVMLILMAALAVVAVWRDAPYEFWKGWMVTCSLCTFGLKLDRLIDYFRAYSSAR